MTKCVFIFNNCGEWSLSPILATFSEHTLLGIVLKVGSVKVLLFISDCGWFTGQAMIIANNNNNNNNNKSFIY